MNWKKEEKTENKGRYEPSRKEMVDLWKEVQPFKQKLMGTKLVSPFDQYLMSLKVQSIDEKGQVTVHDPEGYERLSKINARMELLEYYKWKDGLSEEEMAAHWKRVKEKYSIGKMSLLEKMKI